MPNKSKKNKLATQQAMPVVIESLTREITSMRREYDMFAGYLNVVQNPARIFNQSQSGRLMAGMRLYQTMMDDAHLSSVIQTRELSITKLDWSIVKHPQGQQSDADFVMSVLDYVINDTVLRELLSALRVGYSVSEIIWAEPQAGSTELRMEKIAGRKPELFGFDADGALRYITSTSPDGELMPPNKFIVHRHDALFGSLYGTGLLERLWWYWWIKKNVLKGWALYTDRFATPLTVAKYPCGATPTQKADIDLILRTIQNQTGIRIPDTFSIEFIKAAESGSIRTFQDLLAYCDAAMSKCVLGQTLTTQEGSSGSLALGRVQDETKDDITEADVKNLESTINDQIIYPVCILNAANPATAPFFKFAFSRAADLEAEIKIDKELHSMGYPLSQEYISEKYGRPMIQPGQTPMALPAGSAGAVPQQSATFAEPTGKPAMASGVAARVAAARGLMRRAADGGEKYIDKLAGTYDGVMQQISTLVATAKTWDEAIALADTIDLGNDWMSVMTDLYTRQRLCGYSTGRILSDMAGVPSATFAEGAAVIPAADAAIWDFDMSLTFDDALAWFDARMPRSARDYIEAAEAAKDGAFAVARIESEYIAGEVKRALWHTMDKGLTISESRDLINLTTESLGIGRLKPWHVETVIRTNVMSAYNAGHDEFEQLPEIKQGFPCYLYYGIDDATTRPDHAALHGMVIERTHPFAAYGPGPWDYNCRCGRMAITREEAEATGIRTTDVLWRPPFAA